MITIKAPIELKVRSDLAHGYDAFGERIAGNYTLMGLEIGEEELLHMVSSPPEIYLMDGETTTVGGNTFISSRNEEKYSIVNNMLNRILLSVDGELTYQDRTYITDALYKLGIKDDRKFMNEVRRMIDESHLEEHFLNNYFEMVIEGENRELRQRTLELTKELAEKESYSLERSREDFLSERILHRLRTGAIYQIVSNFNKSLNNTRIELQESMLSEQENVARKLLVQNFLSNVIEQEPELIHAETGGTTVEAGMEQVIREVSAEQPERPGETVRTERTDILEQREREYRETERLRTERETALFGEPGSADIVYREGETGAAEQPEIPGTREERVIVERTRTLEPGTTEYRTTEQIRTGQEPETASGRREEETAPSGERERILSEEQPEERVTERLTEESIRTSERHDIEHGPERTTRYVTEAGETLRTEHEKTELVFREEAASAGSEGGEEEALGTIRETSTFEKEKIERAGEPVISEQKIPGEPGERTTEIRSSRTVELTEGERRVLELRLAEAERIIREEREQISTVRETGGETAVPDEVIRERMRERILSDLISERERTEAETRTEHTDRYVTEQGEILRTEHEGAELVYREGEAAGTETGETEAPGTIRETSTFERERIERAGEPVVSEQRIPGEPGEYTTELRSSLITELTEGERRLMERRLAETERIIREEREQPGTVRETGGEIPVPEEVLRERLRERIASELITERERTEAETRTEHTDRYVTEQGEILRTEHEGAELVYREGEAAGETVSTEEQPSERIRETREIERERRLERERLEKERSSSQTRERIETAVRNRLREQVREELIRAERSAAGVSPTAGRVYERSEMIYRQETAAEEAGVAPVTGRSIREVRQYRSDNVYEREILEKERSRTEITAGLTAAVLLDVVKTLFHAGYDKIGKGDTWIEYRGALYHSAENIFNRLNYNLEEGAEIQISSYTDMGQNFLSEQLDFNEFQEITENAGDMQTIENTIREMNEMNLQNVERYEQMVRVLKTLRPERKRSGGMERTRQEALSILDDEQALYAKLKSTEDEQEEERREVFQEISRIFPDHSLEIFRVVEQYLDGSGQPDRVGITRNNIEAAAEEIRRITAAPTVVQEPVPEPVQTESSELIYRRNDRVTQEELQEMVESFRRSENRQKKEIDQKQEMIETDRRNTTTVTTNTQRTLSRQDAEDIEALVSRGVRSQMSAISEQVLQKLEKKLRNEKIRRGI